MTNWKTAKCLRIKGLAIPDEDPVANETSKNQQKISSLVVNSDDISESTDITDLSSHCTSPPRKRQRKDSVHQQKTNSEVEVSNIEPRLQPSSFSEQESPAKVNYDPVTSPGNQIKAETDIQNEEGPSNLEDGELSCQNLAEIGPEDNGMDDSNEIEEDYPTLTEIDIEKEELNISNNEEWIDFEGAGPSGLQKVS